MAENTKPKRKSNYLQFLPSIYHNVSQGEETHILEALLLAFEDLTQKDASPLGAKAVEEIIKDFPTYLAPHQTPAEFVEWLASWFSLPIRKGAKWEGLEDLHDKEHQHSQRIILTEERQSVNRRIVSRLAPKLHQRGTKSWLELVIEVLFEDDVENIKVNELVEAFQLANKESAILGENTSVGEARPYYFRVRMKLRGFKAVPQPTGDDGRPQMGLVQISTRPSFVRDKKAEIAQVLDQEKPAHTYYTFLIDVPPMQIGRFCTVGFNTMIGHTTM